MSRGIHIRTKRISRPALAGVVMAGLVATGGLAALAETVSASAPLAIGRIAGPNRYATAVDIARATFGGRASLATVILATGDNFPDALTASYLAGQIHTAILLTDPGSLSSATQAGLQGFGTKAVDLVGGPSAVSNSVVSSLVGMGISVTRIFDQDGCNESCSRYDTMASVDTLPGMTPGTSTGPNSQSGLVSAPGQRTAILATGDNFPDALAAGPLAVADHFPIVLTSGSAPSLSPQAAAVIKADQITHLIVVGGASAINPAQYSHLHGITVDWSSAHGANRSQTSELLALDGVEHYGLSDTVVNIANGYDPSFTGVNPQPRAAPQNAGLTVDLHAVSLGTMRRALVSSHSRPGSGTSSDLPQSASSSLVGFTPDALAGAVLGGTGAPLAPTLITDSPTNPGFVVNFVRAEASSLSQGDVFGGTAAVSAAAMAQVLAAVPGATADSQAALGSSAVSLVAGGSPSGPSIPSGAGAATAVAVALAQQGVPYVYGGSSPAGFDCSGLVMYAWAAAGIDLPHNSVAQYDDTTEVPFADIAPGDLVFYDVPGAAEPGHVAMYIGGGQVVVADNTGTLVRVQSLYADGTPMGYGRVA